MSWPFWTPEDHRKSVILQQLQNPRNNNNTLLPILPRKSTDLTQINQTDLNNDITENGKLMFNILISNL